MTEVPKIIYCIETFFEEIYNNTPCSFSKDFEVFTDETQYIKRLNELQYENIKIHKYIANRVE